MSEISRTYTCGRFVVTDITVDDAREQLPAPGTPLPVRRAIDPRSPQALHQLYMAWKSTQDLARKVQHVTGTAVHLPPVPHRAATASVIAGASSAAPLPQPAIQSPPPDETGKMFALAANSADEDDSNGR